MADEVDAEGASREAEFLKALEDREKRGDAAFRAGKLGDALRIALENPPFASKDQAIKDRASAQAVKAILAIGTKDAELTPFLESLSPDQADVLMKYVYK